MSETKSAAKALKEKLFMDPKNAALRMEEAEVTKAFAFCDPYKGFLDASKTEREAVVTGVKLLEGKGYRPFDPATKYKAGDKV